MNLKLFAFAIFVVIAPLLQSCTTSKRTIAKEVTTTSPKPLREFRAAWIASVANINWPSKPGLSTAEQQHEAIALLDYLKEHNFNAVILQVRPQTDALYKSDLEPWSYYLTGKQGQAPNPYYDPLEFWIEAAHDRGLELHAWLNPYRAHHIAGEISDQSIIKKHPELVVELMQGYWWLDPAKKGTQDHSAAVVMDLVRRYDLDGIHFDDYFYPYPEYNKNEDFPDNDSWNEYQQSGGKLSRGDWRRKSVNDFIERLYKSIKAEKPQVKFGLSPFGISRPGNPESIEGFDQYDKLYADAKLWLNEGWIDYFTPQLYWTINKIPQSFPVLLGWWSKQNYKNRHLWPGINVGADTGYKTVNETINEIMISRGMLPESKGVVHWSISAVVKNIKLGEALLNGPYKNPALVPATYWLDKKRPDPPAVTSELHEDKLHITWNHGNPNDVFRWVIYYKYGEKWSSTILNRKDRSIDISRTSPDPSAAKIALTEIAVTAVNRVGNESALRPIAVNK